jgi:hypothetical protein
MSSIGFVEGAVDVAAPALHGRVSLSATVVVFTAFHALYFFGIGKYPF